MPGGDRTGPAGMGPMTGRAGGYCAGSGAPGYAMHGGAYGFGRGHGRGFGRGFGRGWGHHAGAGYGYGPVYGSYAGPTREQELSALKAQSEYLEQTMKTIQDRMTELEKNEG